MELFEGSTGTWIKRSILAVVILLAVFLGLQSVSALTSLRYIGAGVAATNTITVSGYGESLAVPDIATFNFSVVSDKTTVADAQADATAKANAISAYLKSAGVADADIQTSDYSISPQYTYNNTVCAPGIYCPGGNQTLTGYEVSQTTTIKVRDTSKAGDLLAGVGSKGATEVSGLTFTFDNPNQGQDEARTNAIADAKSKADELAKELGVSLVRVVSFSENGSGGYPQPVMYAAMGATTDSKAAAAPDISVGQNKVTSNVSITYEIR